MTSRCTIISVCNHLGVQSSRCTFHQAVLRGAPGSRPSTRAKPRTGLCLCKPAPHCSSGARPAPHWPCSTGALWGGVERTSAKSPVPLSWVGAVQQHGENLLPTPPDIPKIHRGDRAASLPGRTVYGENGLAGQVARQNPPLRPGEGAFGQHTVVYAVTE